MVQKILRAQRRLARTRRDGAIMAVRVENAQLGVSWHAMRSGRPHHARNSHGARPRRTPA